MTGAGDVRDAVHERMSAIDADPGTIAETLEGDVEDRLKELGYL